MDNYQEGDDQFTLVMEDVDEEICALMQKQLGQRSTVRNVECYVDGDGKSIATLTFNKDLSNKPIASDFEDNEEGCTGAGYKWCSGLSTAACKKDCCSGITLNSCQESCDSSTGEITNKEDGTDCTTSDGKDGMCNSGVCKLDYSGVECTDYQNNTECGGKGSGWYCQFSPYDCIDSGTGTCTAVGSGTSIKDGVYLRSPTDNMNWWSAYSWCKGNSMDLVTGTIADIPLNSEYDNGGGNGPLYQYFGEDIYFWTGHDSGDSCLAWRVNVHSYGELVFGSPRNSSYYYALCQE